MRNATHIDENVGEFQRIMLECLGDMLHCSATALPMRNQKPTPKAGFDMPFAVNIQYVIVSDEEMWSGDYTVVMDERVAAAACGLVGDSAEAYEVMAIRMQLSDVTAELLNTVVGFATTSLEKSGDVTVGPPLIRRDDAAYGGPGTRMAVVQIPAGNIECIFRCDVAGN